MTPRRTHERAQVFQRIRSDREIEFPVDERIDIHQACHEPINGCLIASAQLCDCSRLITPVMVNGGFRIPLEMREQLAPDTLFITGCVCLQGMIRLVVTLTYQQPYQIMEALIGYALEVQEQCHWWSDEFRQFLDIDFACPYRQRLEFEVKTHGLRLRDFPPSSWCEPIR